MDNRHRNIGLLGAVTILVGFVTSASVFVLPASLSALAGPSMILAFAIAALPALLSCLVAAQISSFFPVSGASYLAITRLTSPLLGFLSMWLLMAGAAIGMALLSIGAANYAATLVDVDRQAIALGLVASIGLLNMFSTKLAVSAQELLVLIFLLAVGVFLWGGAEMLERGNFEPFMPKGLSGVMAAAVLAYFAYTGFLVIIDVGGEVKKPQRNIPLALLISFLTVLGLYFAINAVLIGGIPWQQLATLDAPVQFLAEQTLPAPLVKFIILATVFAAASTVNGILLGYSRDLKVMADEGRLPAFFGRTHWRRAVPGSPVSSAGQRLDESPRAAIASLCLLAGALIVISGEILQYAVFVAFAALLVQIGLGLSLLRANSVAPELYRQAAFKLPRTANTCAAAGLIAVSGFFLVAGALDNPGAALAAGLYLVAGTLYYVGRNGLKGSLASRAVLRGH
ncbi:APC family permease [Parahaliea mediterranea]|uniref:Amino acid permease n=1 Tax=Parahaliea mediterranea TaxID=651086 RepID=A0A939IMR9_9GAMM|nr:APC family permease [Parahaliea mediterranea]MBN7797820.1 amino acid permease [Parahaliea mediterranea]